MNATNFIDIFLEDINIQEIDLNSLYNEYNKLLFKDKLPKIPVIVSTLKHVGGRAEAKITPDKKIIPTKILISDMFKRSDLIEIKSILIHEMIHIFFFTNQMIRDIGGSGNHGIFFESEIKRIEPIVGFKIPITDEVREVSDTVKSKDLDVIIKHDPDDARSPYIIAIFKKGILTAETIKEYHGYLEGWDRCVYILQTNNRYLLKFPFHTKFKHIRWYKIPVDNAQEILRSGKLITTIPAAKEKSNVATR